MHTRYLYVQVTQPSECICMYVCAVALSTREGASEKPAPVAYEQRETHTMCGLRARLGEYNARKHE